MKNINANNNYNSTDIFLQIKQKLMDEEFINKYGTSSFMNMDREYKNYIEQTYEKLKGQFEIINKNPTDGITREELIDFLKSNNKNEVEFNPDNVDKIFEVVDLNKDKEIQM
jgi:hypothetical protein